DVLVVRAVDDLVDKALVDYSIAKHKAKKPGMILINNPWGESNEKGLKAALAAKTIPYAGIEKFETNDVDVVPQLSRLKEAGADVLFLVANVAPSAQVVKSLDRMNCSGRVPLGPGRRTVLGAGRTERRKGPLHSDLQFLR